MILLKDLLKESELSHHYDSKIETQLKKMVALVARGSGKKQYEIHELARILQVPSLPLSKFLNRATLFHDIDGVDITGNTVYFT